MKFLYGYDSEHLVDISYTVFQKCLFDKYILIPSDNLYRTHIFGDPFPDILKHIFIIDDFENTHIFHSNKEIKINFESISSQLRLINNPKLWYNTIGKSIIDPLDRLNTLQKNIAIEHGNFSDEYPEQLMAIRYINENSKVLEIGGNIGRNTLIINSILKDSKNLVTLESDPNIAKLLQGNLKINSFESHVEPSALSLVPLIQNNWNTLPISDGIIPDGWKEVSTISYSNLVKKYNIDFDTLIIDCEGALYYILKDDSSILNNIKLIIIENDFLDVSHKNFIDNLFKTNGLNRIYSESGGWGPCYDMFYEVWKKS